MRIETNGPHEKNESTHELQNNLVHYLSNMWGYQDRPEEILAAAKKQEISLDLDTAVKEGIIGALKEQAPENLNLIIAFAKQHQITIDLVQPDIQKAIADCYAVLLSKTKPTELSDLKKFIDRHEVLIDENLIFQQALVMCLNQGHGEKANILANKIEKEKKDINFSGPEITEALKQGLLINLREGRADLVNRLTGFASRRNLNVETNEPEFIIAAKEGLIKSIKDMKLGPGAVTIAEGMIKLILKLKLPIDLSNPEIAKASKEALEASKKSSTRFPNELQTFSAYPHIEAFLKKYGINIDL